MSLRFSAIFSIAMVCGVSITAAEKEGKQIWPQWRGPARDAHIPSTDWPDRLDESHLKQQWRVELSPSYSGPIVAEDRVFTTETVDRKEEFVRAFSLADGKELWQAKWEGALTVPFFARSNGSWIRSTPAYDLQSDTLYVAGIRDVLVALNAKTGQERWKLDFVDKFNAPLPAFGFVCSPLVIGDAVYVQAGGSFVKVDKATGKVHWRVLKDGGGMWGSAFSSPIYAEMAGKPQLVVQTRQQLAGVDAQNGTVLWSKKIPAFRGMNILTPLVNEDRVFISSYGGGSRLIEIESKEAEMAVNEVWTNRAQGYMSSPVLIDDHIYLHLRNQRFTCIDLKTGQSKWTTKPYGKYWSMVASGDRILALDETGDVYLIRANPKEFELLDSRHISDDATWAHLAVSGGRLFVRELKALACYQWK